jgi:hypothetical protein
MVTPLILAAALALQAAPAPAPAPTPAPAPPPAETITPDDLPIDQAAAARCAIAYATVGRWQTTGDARGRGFADVAAGGGREFFVQVMVRLMDDAGLTRAHVQALAARGFADYDTPDGLKRIEAMMPACELMKSAAGL